MLQSYLPDIKLFLKHLLATFLGLLMALGMEQWHEHYRETKWARAFLQQILVDLRQNRIDLKDTLAAQGGTFRIRGLSEEVAETIHLAGLEKRLGLSGGSATKGEAN